MLVQDSPAEINQIKNSAVKNGLFRSRIQFYKLPEG
jgi:hypothetical protein